MTNPTTPPPLPSERDVSGAMAVVSLVFGLIALLTGVILIGGLAGIVGIITGIVHLRRSRVRRAAAGWGIGLSSAGLALAAAVGGMYWLFVQPVLTGLQDAPAESSSTSASTGEPASGNTAAATHTDTRQVGIATDTKAASLSSFCLDTNDNIVACDEAGKCLRVISPDDILIAKWPLDFAPQAAALTPDGAIVVAGRGRVALLDGDGKALASGAISEPPVPAAGRHAAAKTKSGTRANRTMDVVSAGAMGDDVFACARADRGYTVYRMSKRLDGATPIIEGLNGCCGQMDITARDNALYVAANCETEVVAYDRDGRKTGSFGKDKANAGAYFNGCCEPKNVCVGPDGSLYVAESAQRVVNRFSKDGQFLDRVGGLKGMSGCVRVTVAVNHDASLVYMLDTEHNSIHVLARNAGP